MWDSFKRYNLNLQMSLPKNQRKIQEKKPVHPLVSFLQKNYRRN